MGHVNIALFYLVVNYSIHQTFIIFSEKIIKYKTILYIYIIVLYFYYLLLSFIILSNKEKY